MMKLRFYIIITFVIILLPTNAFAHGTEEEHAKENVFYNQIVNGGLLTSVILLALSIVIIIILTKKMKAVNVRIQQGQKTRNPLKRNTTVFMWIGCVTLVSSLVFGFLALTNNNKESESATEFHHIHGLGFSNDGSRFYIPAHDGLRVFADGQWSIPEGEKHDYMGFSMVDDGFYSSGHPGQGSKLENPFGVVKSSDFGKSLDILDLYKEIDFHGMAVGYYSHAIYVLNPQPNSRMDDTGLYYTLDDTKTWTKSKMEGLDGKPASLAVHPSDERILAIGTNKGAFLSTDYGHTFVNILPNVPTSAIHFSKENELAVGGIEGESVLYKINLDTQEETQFTIPQLSSEDVITYIAVNPQDSHEIVFTTFEKQIFISYDNGENWTQIGMDGTGVNTEEE